MEDDIGEFFCFKLERKVSNSGQRLDDEEKREDSGFRVAYASTLEMPHLHICGKYGRSRKAKRLTSMLAYAKYQHLFHEVPASAFLVIVMAYPRHLAKRFA